MERLSSILVTASSLLYVFFLKPNFSSQVDCRAVFTRSHLESMESVSMAANIWNLFLRVMEKKSFAAAYVSFPVL